MKKFLQQLKRQYQNNMINSFLNPAKLLITCFNFPDPEEALGVGWFQNLKMIMNFLMKIAVTFGACKAFVNQKEIT